MTKTFGHILLAAVLVGVLALLLTQPATASAATWKGGKASAYGKGLFGNTTACGQTLRRGTVGVAHKTLPCGTRVSICNKRKCRTLKVIDRGPYSGNRIFDLTLGAVKLYGVSSEANWGVRWVRWRKVS